LASSETMEEPNLAVWWAACSVSLQTNDISADVVSAKAVATSYCVGMAAVGKLTIEVCLHYCKK